MDKRDIFKKRRPGSEEKLEKKPTSLSVFHLLKVEKSGVIQPCVINTCKTGYIMNNSSQFIAKTNY